MEARRGWGPGREGGAGHKPDSAGWRLALTVWPNGGVAGTMRRAIVRGSWPERLGVGYKIQSLSGWSASSILDKLSLKTL